MRRWSCWAAATLAVLAAGCGPYFEYIPVAPVPRQLYVHGAAEVQTFLFTPPARPHVDIAMLRVTTNDATVEEMIALLRAKAGQFGCDALLVTSVKVLVHPSMEGSCEIYIDAPPART
jgi:hypothetical protein